MTPQLVEEMRKSIFALLSKSMRLEARCDALEIALGVLSQQANIPPERIHKMIDDMTALSFQKRLERAEGANPAIAAELDTRSGVPDLPDDLEDESK